MKNNFLNKKFGRLTVVAPNGYIKQGNRNLFSWKCKCECGNHCVILAQNLNRKSTNSCGCIRKELVTKDLTGKTFGYLTVVRKYGTVYVTKKDRAVLWECRCSCGNVYYVKTTLLCSGKVKSCGCLKKGKNKIELTGRTFGDIKVLKFIERKDNRTFWLCECKCGKIKSIDGHHLTSGQRSCGCKMGGWKHGLTKDKKLYYKFLMSDPVRKLRHRVSNQIRKCLLSSKNGSIIGKLPYTIQELRNHLESLWEPWMNWENYGGRPSDNKKTWWIDHISPQSKLKYKSMDDVNFMKCWQLSNIRPLEKIANIKKGVNEF